MLFIQVIKIHYASTSCIYLHVLGDETFITATSYKDDSSESRGASDCFLRPSVYCYCQQEEYGRMVGCDNNDCPYEWFHLDCLKLKALPKSSKWYCPDCRKYCTTSQLIHNFS
jgi:hypothetical protein